MASVTELFFEKFATALDSGSTDTIAQFHHIPTVFVTDDNKRICTQKTDLIAIYAGLVDKIQEAGIKRHHAQLYQAMRLSDSVVFANVQWKMYNEQDQLHYTSHCSYTLQKKDGDDPKIIVAVLDDEAKIMANLINQL